MPADAGIRFGHYVLVRRIARGGMAEVFLAQQHGLEGFDRRVAVKRILPHLADSPDFVKMFLGEAKLAAQLSHPNIVHIYEFGKVEGDYFIAMEFVEGVHAGQLFDHGGLPATLVARIGADAANALSYAHELRGPSGKPYGLVHRDVSPANIMVSFDGVVKLCDFGIAKAAALTVPLTNPGHVKGKYAYMSPEQTIAAPLDGRSDVFSLAIVLWELLTGKVIVPRGDAVEAMRALRDGRIEPIERAAPHVPPALGKAITWALDAKRDYRATAVGLAQALEAFIKSSPELATSLQLGGWVRSRFPRELAERPSDPAVPVPTGTIAPMMMMGSPGTPSSPSEQNQITPSSPRTASVQSLPMPSSPGTASEQNPITPSQLSIATQIVSRLTDSAELYTGSEIEVSETKLGGPVGDTTVIDGMSRRVGDDSTVLGGAATIGHDDTVLVDARETLERPRRLTLSSAPAAVPTTPPSLRLRTVSGDLRTRAPLPPGKRRMRRAIAVAGLVALAIVSFLIVLAASRARGKTGAHDAAVGAAGHPDAGIASDAAAQTIGSAPDAYLEIRTIPDGSTIRVGDRIRMAPSHLVLPAGHVVVIAELPGYQPERHELDLAPGEHQEIEIVFTHRIATPHPPPNGRGGAHP